jgi:precorrin-3B synthase
VALGSGDVALLLAGVDSGLRSCPAGAVDLALSAARAFLEVRAAQGGTAWRVAELADGPARIAAALGGRRAEPVAAPAPPVSVPAGAVVQDDGRTALIAVVPLGRLDTGQAELLADVAVDDVQLTPWRSVVVPDLDDASAIGALTDAGLVLDPASDWLRVTACAGRPGCAKSLADVRGDVVRAVSAGTLPMDGARQHWAGCERRCGRPSGDVVDVVATATGYRIG